MSDDISIPTRPTYRVPRQRGMDPATRRLALIAAGIGGTLMVVVGGYSMLGGGHQGIPVVQAQPGPVRVKPADPGGMQVAGAGNDIFSGGSDTSVDKLAPPPETPDLQALRAPPPPPKPAPAPAKPAEPAHAVAVATAAPEVKPVVARAPVKPAEQHAAARPAPAPAAEHDARGQPAAAGHGKTMVQLAALSSEPAAKAEWYALQHRFPDLFSSRQPAFSKTEHDGRVFWRVRTGGFADPAQARVFCDRMHAKGFGCSVADF